MGQKWKIDQHYKVAFTYQLLVVFLGVVEWQFRFEVNVGFFLLQ
jgi:hypothetical protein